MTKGYDFTIGGGRTTDERGKAHWPAALNLWIPRKRALELLAQIAGQLQDDEADEIHVAWSGKMEQTE